MTGTQLADALLEAQALNAVQQRLGWNPGGECDSILEHADEIIEHAQALYRGATAEQREHLIAIARHVAAQCHLARQLLKGNAAERELEREVAGVVDLLGAGRPRERWTIRAIASALRGPLANVASPLCGPVALEAAHDQIARVLGEAPVERVGTRERPNATLAHELGPRKYGLLLDLVDVREGATAG